jgi:hypothetical protein
VLHELVSRDLARIEQSLQRKRLRHAGNIEIGPVAVGIDRRQRAAVLGEDELVQAGEPGYVHDVGIAARQRQHLVCLPRDEVRQGGEFLRIAGRIEVPVIDAEHAVDGADHLLRPRHDMRIEQAADERAEHRAGERAEERADDGDFAAEEAADGAADAAGEFRSRCGWLREH